MANRKSPMAKQEDAASGTLDGLMQARRCGGVGGMGRMGGIGQMEVGERRAGRILRIWAGRMRQPLSGLGSFSRLLTQGSDGKRRTVATSGLICETPLG
jgi:hypothetical protein